MVHQKRLVTCFLSNCPVLSHHTNKFTRTKLPDCRALSTLPEKAEKPRELVEKRPLGRRPSNHNPALEFRHVYPEFLPDPNPKWRNSLREKLERIDMLNRRNKIDIPEFYVGKLLFVLLVKNSCCARPRRRKILIYSPCVKLVYTHNPDFHQ